MTDRAVQEVLRRIPSVDAMLKLEGVRMELERHPRTLVLESIRSVLDSLRRDVLEGSATPDPVDLDPDHLLESFYSRLREMSEHTLRPVVNGTGIIVHTNLGRSLLPEEAVERLALIARGYNNLEYDIGEGRRGSRYVHAEGLLLELTGAEAALVVNNNAAAVYLVLSTLAAGKEVIVSRGELVEIGGSFRIPDVMRGSGAILKEVGATNRTHPRDYESAIWDETALLMKVHTSNYKMIGFTSSVALPDLVRIGRKNGIPVVEDLGSGSLIDLSKFGLRGEPTVQDSVSAGADIVTFSGDKLLGGPQAGMILGRRDLIAQCRKNPMTRALRVDKMTLGALEATLRLYRDERFAVERIPTLRMIALPLEQLEARARELAQAIRELDPEGVLGITVAPVYSQVGGGSLPEQNLASCALATGSERMTAHSLETFFRAWKPAIVGRIESDRFILDVRTLLPADDRIIQDAFASVISGLTARA